MGISDWPVALRPRERLINQGAQVLSDAELLAIFLRTGLPGCSAIDLAQRLLLHFGSLGKLCNAAIQDFCAFPGLGPAKIHWCPVWGDAPPSLGRRSDQFRETPPPSLGRQTAQFGATNPSVKKALTH